MLTLICGLPRAGKTTYSKKYDGYVLHYDEIGRKDILKAISNYTGDVVVEGVYNCLCDRIKLLQTYLGTGKQCIWLDTPREIREKRPMYTIHSNFPFEPPTFDEGWDEIIIIRGDDEQRYCRQTEN